MVTKVAESSNIKNGLKVYFFLTYKYDLLMSRL